MRVSFLDSGPVAQLGARFHGMEEVIGSIPIRSTNQPTNLADSQKNAICFGYVGPHAPPPVQSGAEHGFIVIGITRRTLFEANA